MKRVCANCGALAGTGAGYACNVGGLVGPHRWHDMPSTAERDRGLYAAAATGAGNVWLCACGQFNTVQESACMACGSARG